MAQIMIKTLGHQRGTFDRELGFGYAWGARSQPVDTVTVIAFDTLKFAKRLKEAGFTDQQAEALAAAEAELIEENLATKRDLKETEAELKRDIKELETALKRDIKELEGALRNEIKQTDLKIELLRSDLSRDLRELEYRLTIKLGAMLVVAVGLLATLLKFL
jgi:hypothetical protein